MPQLKNKNANKPKWFINEYRLLYMGEMRVGEKEDIMKSINISSVRYHSR